MKTFVCPAAALVATLFICGAKTFAGEYYVSPKGSDAGPGSSEKPFATISRARDAIRAAPKSGDPITVWIKGGDYFLPESLELSAQDSGTSAAPTTYRNVGDEAVHLIGARHLAASDFKEITDGATLTRIASTARGKVLEVDLRAIGVKHNKVFPDVFTDSGGLVDLYMNGRRMPLSRFPNSGYMTIKRVLDNAGGPKIPGSANNDPGWLKANESKSGGVFEYREEFFGKHASWQKQVDRGVWLKGYWRIPWQNEAIRLKDIDTTAHTVTFSKPVSGGIGSKYKRPAGSGQEPYWLLNLLEEIDEPGEWCVDFRDQKLYFYPPASLNDAELLLADSDKSVVTLDNASHIILRGLTFEESLSEGVLVKNGSSNLVAGCTVRNVDRYGIKLDGGKENTVQSCDLYDLGAGGVWLGGGDELSNPRVPAGHRVVNNHIHHFAQLQRIYAPGVNCGFTGGGGGGHHPAVGMYVGHNLIHDTPHGGVLFGSWDNVFEFNEVFRYCTVSNDLGAFYSYDSYALDGNQTFRYNFMHSTDDGDGLYWDNDHREMHVYGNIAYLKSSGGKRGTGFLYKIGTQAKNPQSIECYNNVAINCNYGFVFVSALTSRIENNITVDCPHPWTWRGIKEGKESTSTAEGLGASSSNRAYDSNPGFVEIDKMNFRLSPGSQLLKDLPEFQPIPVEKIGLFIDEYRKRLPTDSEIDRFDQRRLQQTGAGFEVEDRK